MTIKEITVPDIGGIADVEVIELNVSVGDKVSAEDPIIVLESDKATMEVPAPEPGTVIEMKLSVGDKVSEGDLILLLKPIEESQPQEAVTDNKKEVITDSPDKSEKDESEEGESTYIEQILVPDLGGIQDVPIIELSVKVGDQIAEEDAILVLESDKASMEIPSPKSGKLIALTVKEGDKVSQGDLIGQLEVTSKNASSPVANVPVPSVDKATAESKAGSIAEKAETPKSSVMSRVEEQPENSDKTHAGPAVRKLARELGVYLSRVQPTGPRGRILKEDLQAYIKQQIKQAQSGSVGGATGIPAITLPDFSQFGKVTRKPLSRIHRITAENMHANWLNVPHVTQFDDVDITELESFRKAQKGVAEKRGTRLTPLPFLLKACAYALQTYPQFNVSLDLNTQELIQKHYINIGVAVDTPAGLMVPVIKEVDKKSLWELAEETMELAAKAKDKKLKPAEMQGGCFTISSLGSVGGTAFTPIVNSPEVAILGVSKSAMKPVYIDKQFEPRLMLPLSLSYDHRAVNGADAARFTTLLSVLLGDIRQLLL